MKIKPIFIGIAGPTGAGKTTLCKRLKQNSKNIEHVRLDYYFKDPKTFPTKFGFKNWEKPSNIKFDILLQHLKKLKAGKVVKAKFFAGKPEPKSFTVIFKPKKYVLVEGFLLFKNKNIRDLLDKKIYLDIPPKLMLQRRVERFGGDYITEYDVKVVIPEFLKTGITQKKFADYVIDATRQPRDIIKEVRKILHENRS